MRSAIVCAPSHPLRLRNVASYRTLSAQTFSKFESARGRTVGARAKSGQNLFLRPIKGWPTIIAGEMRWQNFTGREATLEATGKTFALGGLDEHNAVDPLAVTVVCFRLPLARRWTAMRSPLWKISTPQAHRFPRHPAEMIICRTLATYKGRSNSGRRYRRDSRCRPGACATRNIRKARPAAP